jgi:hypothetical protein
LPFLSLEGGGLFGTGITGEGIADIIGAIRGGGGGGGNAAMPGGAALFDLPGIDIVGQGMASTGGCGSAFRANGCGGATAQRHVKISPKGKPVWFGPIGNPILFQGDLTAVKRVDRVAKRAARGRRRPR